MNKQVDTVISSVANDFIQKSISLASISLISLKIHYESIPSKIQLTPTVPVIFSTWSYNLNIVLHRARNSYSSAPNMASLLIKRVSKTNKILQINASNTHSKQEIGLEFARHQYKACKIDIKVLLH